MNRPAATARHSEPDGWSAVITGDRLPRFALVCVGVWLNAAETLMTATIMPSVAADIHGEAWFGWVVAIYLLGSILAGATSARLAQALGLKRALAAGALIYTLGCMAAALAPTIPLFVAGRLLQGVGGGWITGLSFIAVTRLFPQSLWSRVLSALAGVWGVASLVSPLVGGLFAQAGFWRGAFWIFAIQGLAFIAAAAMLVPRSVAHSETRSGPIPWGSLAALAGAILSIAAAGLTGQINRSAPLAIAGLVLLALFFRLNHRAKAPMIPRQAANPLSGTGAGLAMIFCTTAATASITAYLPALLQTLYGATPVLAGYLLVSEAMAWTICAFLAASWPRPRLAIRAGAVMIVAGLVLFASIIPHGGLWLAPICSVIEGAGFGLAWAFTIARLVANAPPEEQAIASASAPTMQTIGAAVGSAASGVIAGLLGFGHGITVARATLGGFWLFAAFVPLAALGGLAAWRLASPRFDVASRPSDTID